MIPGPDRHLVEELVSPFLISDQFRERLVTNDKPCRLSLAAYLYAKASTYANLTIERGQDSSNRTYPSEIATSHFSSVLIVE